MPVEKSEERDEFHVLTDSGTYTEHHYTNEKELEQLVVAHAEEVFGKNTLYVDVKQKIASKFQARITDGLLLDFRKKPIPHLWVVEYELGSHDLEKHVIPQLRGFVKAFDNEETITALRNAIYQEISRNEKKLRKFKELAQEREEVYLTVDKALQGDATILLVYDRLPWNIEERFDESDFTYDTYFMVFRTFEREGKLVHLVNPLHSFEESARTVELDVDSSTSIDVGGSVEEKMDYIRDSAVKELCKKCLAEFSTADILPRYGHWVVVKRNSREFLWIGFRQWFFAIEYLQRNGRWSRRTRIYDQDDWEKARGDFWTP